MSKSDKKLKIPSSTEIKQAPFVQNNNTKKLKTKDKITPTKSNHKHDYQIVSMSNWLRNSNRGKLYSIYDSESFIIEYKCSICGKENSAWKLIEDTDWNDKYKDIYERLFLESEREADMII